MSDQEQIEYLLAQDEDELMLELGESLSDSMGLAASKNRKSLIQHARKWYKTNKKIITAAICDSRVLERYVISDEYEKRIEIVAAIADVIATKWTGVPPFVLSVMIFREGIRTLCK